MRHGQVGHPIEIAATDEEKIALGMSMSLATYAVLSDALCTCGDDDPDRDRCKCPDPIWGPRCQRCGCDESDHVGGGRCERDRSDCRCRALQPAESEER